MYEKFLGFFVATDVFFENISTNISTKISDFCTTYLDPLFATTSFMLLFCVSLILFFFVIPIIVTYKYENRQKDLEKVYVNVLENSAKNNEEDEKETIKTN